MDLVVRKKEFFHELQLFQGIVERKNTIPVLANVLLEAEGDKARMVATDLEVALDVRFSDKVKNTMKNDALKITININMGKEKAIAYGCDMSYDYININARYTT